MTKNITVTDVNGDIIGTTYPKRAKGLVKNGRACYVGASSIQMSASHALSGIENISEENSMNYITFKGEEWLRRDVDISFMSNPIDGSITQALMLGNWDNCDGCFKDAHSKIMILSPATEYRFVFWLNGGENEKGNEICQFKVAFSSDWENCNVYKLNRGYIRPLLHQKGWELYELPFRTPEAAGDVSVTFAFAAGRAPMAVIPALEPSSYKDLKDEPDQYADYRPQRHNIVFKDGWPSINQYGGDKYSTQAIRNKLESKKMFSFGNNNFNFSFSKNSHDDEDDEDAVAEALIEELEEQCDEVENRLDNLDDMISDIEDTISDAGDEIDDIMDDEDTVASVNKDELSNCMGELIKIQAALPTCEAELKSYTRVLKQISKRIGRDDTESLSAEVEELSSKISSFEERANRLQAQAEIVADQVSSLSV